MINLLPPDTRRQLHAARQNVTLRTYFMLVICAAALLGGIFAVGLQVTIAQKAVAEAERDAAVNASAQYQTTKNAIQAFVKDLAVAKGILANNVSFSTLVTDIAGVVPPGVILNNLALGTNVNTPIDISGRARTRDDSIKLKNNLEASPIFEGVRVTNLSSTDTSQLPDDSIAKKYPFNVTLNVKFTKPGQEAPKP